MRRGRVTLEMRRAIRREAIRDREDALEIERGEDHELAAAAHGCCPECLEELTKGHTRDCKRGNTEGRA